MEYEPLDERSLSTIQSDLRTNDDEAFTRAMLAGAYHLDLGQFDALLCSAAPLASTAMRQRALSEAIIVMVQARRLVPTFAVEVLLSLSTEEPSGSSKQEALDLIRRRSRR